MNAIEQYFLNVKNVKPKTMENYINMLTRLNEGEKPTTADFLKDHKRIFDFLDDKYSLTTQRTYLICIVSLLQSREDMEKEKDIYYNRLQELNFQYNSGIDEYKKSAREEENMCELEELKLIANFWVESLDDVLYDNSLHGKVFQTYKMALVALLYTELPPIRLDWANFIIVHNQSEIEDNKNYVLIEESGKMSFILQKYKTSKTHKTKTFHPTEKLKNVINDWLTLNDSGYLFPNQKQNGPMSENAFGKMIPKAFESTGKKITLNILRHVWISANVDHAVLDYNDNLAAQMCHTTGTQRTYIKV